MGTVNLELFKQFSEQPALEIDLITSSADDRFVETQFAEQIMIYRLPIHPQNLHHASNLELIRYAALAFRLAIRLHRANPYDLCFAWSGVPAGGVAYLLNRLINLPYVVRVCGPDIPGFERRYAGLYPLLTPIIRAIWRRADRVIAKCQEEVDMIHAVDDRADTVITPNGVSLEAFDSGSREPAAGSLRVLCVGRLIERKGQSQLIEAARRLKAEQVPLYLDFVGTGDALEAYQAEVAHAGLTDQVTFHGYIPREDISASYQKADIFVLPSYNEGMSVATLEAMAAGLPVLVTRTGGSSELVREGINGHQFDWGDVDHLVSLLRVAAENRAQLLAMGAASRAHAARFSWSTAADQYLALFSELNPPHKSTQIAEQATAR